jgi:AraC-like DNA-binding protein
MVAGSLAHSIKSSNSAASCGRCALGSSEHFSRPIDTAARHTEQVYSVIGGEEPLPSIEEVSTSWKRSAQRYGVNPETNEAPRILTLPELGKLRQPLDEFIFSAQEEIDRLYRMVRDAGYTILLCNTAGVAVEHRGEEAEADQFRYWGTWLGGVWSEELEGTNGIGTCIIEERPITIHRGQHFRSRNKDLSCSGAPIFDVDGRLIAVLDVSAIDPGRSERAHALTGALTVKSARAIEERFFRERFRRQWIVAIALPEGSVTGMLLAVDGSQRIIGADRVARRTLHIEDETLRADLSLWSFFLNNADLFRRNNQVDIPARLVLHGGNAIWSALVTPPERALGHTRDPMKLALHTRPRLDLMSALKSTAPIPPSRGGLSPGAMRRVREYVEAHLNERIQLTELAAVAGLSVYHFAREFKHSVGVTPHYYIVQSRVEQAQAMLAHTDLSVAEIALAAGYSDQSHLTRQFRQILGTTPRNFRWSQR